MECISDGRMPVEAEDGDPMDMVEVDDERGKSVAPPDCLCLNDCHECANEWHGCRCQVCRHYGACGTPPESRPADAKKNLAAQDSEHCIVNVDVCPGQPTIVQAEPLDGAGVKHDFGKPQMSLPVWAVLSRLWPEPRKETGRITACRMFKKAAHYLSDAAHGECQPLHALREALRFIQGGLDEEGAVDEFRHVRPLCNVMQFGCTKYSRNNWKGGFKFSRMVDAALRHLYLACTDKFYDEETKQHHTGGAVFSIMVLTHMYYNFDKYHEFDDLGWFGDRDSEEDS